jgi:hypothetical protein
VKTFGIVLSWLFGTAFLLTGFVNVINNNFLSAILFFMMAFLLLPPIRKLAYSKTKIELPFYARAISILILFSIFGHLSGQDLDKDTKERRENISEKQKEDVTKAREMIGRWEEDIANIEFVIDIYKQDDKYYMEYKFNEGGTAKTVILQLVKQESTTGKASFKSVDHPGDYFVITNDNYLESRDKMGLISTAMPVK